MIFDFEHGLAELSAQTVLCVGDLMLDEFVYGEVSRISPEAPAPVIAVARQEAVIGGDDGARAVRAALGAERAIEASLVIDRSRPTTRKVRFVAGERGQSTHMLRADWEEAKPIAGEIEDAVIRHAVAALPEAGAVVLSDYAKGTLTERVVRAIIEAAAKLGKPVVVDPKAADFAVYRGATLITPNRKELADATRRNAVTDSDIAAAAADLARATASTAVLVTRSEHGMTLVVRG